MLLFHETVIAFFCCATFFCCCCCMPHSSINKLVRSTNSCFFKTQNRLEFLCNGWMDGWMVGWLCKPSRGVLVLNKICLNAPAIAFYYTNIHNFSLKKLLQFFSVYLFFFLLLCCYSSSFICCKYKQKPTTIST